MTKISLTVIISNILFSFYVNICCAYTHPLKKFVGKFNTAPAGNNAMMTIGDTAIPFATNETFSSITFLLFD